MNLLHLAESCRPRERLLEKGPSSLSDAELLALILRTGKQNENVVDLANRLLKKHSLVELSRVSPSLLAQFDGIGEVKSSQIVACFELARRLFSQPTQIKKQVISAEDVANHFIHKLSFMKSENLFALYLDARMKIIKEELIASGSIDATVLSPRDIFHHAIIEKASAIVLVHNHPSGDCNPSDEDISVTKDLCTAGKLLGIEILDHIVVGNKEYSSMRERELI